MAVDNQLLLATVLAVGLGYFALTRKPQQSADSGQIRKEIQQQNINLQMDQVDEIFKEFKIDWSKRGANAETTPITHDELLLLQGLEKNIRRIDKEVGRSKPYDERADLDKFAARRDDLYNNIERYKNKFVKAVTQNLVDSRATAMDLGNIVEPREHIGLFNSVAPRGYDPSRKEQYKSLSRSRAASLSRVGAYDLGPFAKVTVHGANPGTASQVLADSRSRSVSLGHE